MFSGGLSGSHLLIVAAVALLVFGSKKLPDLARGVGQSLRILKAETTAMKKENGEETPRGEGPGSAAPVAELSARPAAAGESAGSAT